jgi:hypothetical protein
VHAGGRLKQWLMLLRRHYPEAEALYQQLRPVKAAEDIDAMLLAAGIITELPPPFVAQIVNAMAAGNAAPQSPGLPS